jgi:predicted RNA-binding Zn-ribbon protein involved in translation (DUF1610 family)
MVRVNLPPGCLGFKADDGTRYVAKPGTFVDVADHHMKALKQNNYAQAGLVDAGAEKFFVKKGPEGKWCGNCSSNTIYHSWTRICPLCGGETIPESQMSRELPSGQYNP